MSIEILSLTLGAFATNSYIVGNRETGSAIVIDPVDEAATLERRAIDAGLKIRLIVATHGHVDHVLAAEALMLQTTAPFMVHRLSPRLQPRGISDPVLQQLFPPLPRPQRRFGDDDEECGVEGITLQTLYTPGHSPDHVALYLPEAGILFGGDCLFAGSIGRTDFPNADYDVLMESIHRRLLTLPDDTRVLPGHMGPTTIGIERRTNRFVLEYLRRRASRDGPPA